MNYGNFEKINRFRAGHVFDVTKTENRFARVAVVLAYHNNNSHYKLGEQLIIKI